MKADFFLNFFWMIKLISFTQWSTDSLTAVSHLRDVRMQRGITQSLHDVCLSASCTHRVQSSPVQSGPVWTLHHHMCSFVFVNEANKFLWIQKLLSVSNMEQNPVNISYVTSLYASYLISGQILSWTQNIITISSECSSALSTLITTQEISFQKFPCRCLRQNLVKT